MADDFGYLGARVRARRAGLLKEAFFQEALELPFPDFLRLLGETPYGEALAGQTLGDVDRAIAKTQARLVGDLAGLVTGEAREAVRLLLLRNDLTNLQAVLRAKATGRPLEEVVLLPGTLEAGLWPALYEAQDPSSLAQLLAVPGHPLARALRAALRETQDPLRLEVLLAKGFLEEAVAAAKRLGEPFLAGYLALEVDAENLRTAFKLQGQGVDPGEVFIRGGRYLDRLRFARLLEGDLTALGELASTPLASLGEAKDLKGVERGLRCLLLKEARRGLYDPVGVGLVLAYVRERTYEAQRLRLLARRAYFGLPKAQAEEEVRCP